MLIVKTLYSITSCEVSRNKEFYFGGSLVKYLLYIVRDTYHK